MNDNKKALICLITVNFIWGIDFIAIEYVMGYLPAQIYTLLRLLICCILIVPFCIIKCGSILPEEEDMFRVFAAGSIGMSFYFTVENIGTGLTSGGFASLIMSTVPIICIFIDRIVFKRKITIIKISCVAGSVLGVYFLVTGEPLGTSLKGLLVMFLGAVLWSIYIVYVKPLYDKYSLVKLLTGLFISATMTQIVLTLVTLKRNYSYEFNSKIIIITVVTAVVCMLVAEFGYVYAVGKLSVTTVSIFENVLPLTTVIFSFILMHSMLTMTQIIGGILILVSVTALVLNDEGENT